MRRGGEGTEGKGRAGRGKERRERRRGEWKGVRFFFSADLATLIVTVLLKMDGAKLFIINEFLDEDA